MPIFKRFRLRFSYFQKPRKNPRNERLSKSAPGKRRRDGTRDGTLERAESEQHNVHGRRVGFNLALCARRNGERGRRSERRARQALSAEQIFAAGERH